MTSALEFEEQLRALATEEQRIKYQRFFPGKTPLIGVRMVATGIWSARAEPY